MDKRNLTVKQEWAIRLVHHAFGGLTLAKAAKIMGLMPCQVASILKSAEAKAPSLFPILTPAEKLVLDWWKQGTLLPPDAVCEMKISLKEVAASLRKKGMMFARRGMVRFDPDLHNG